MKTQRQREVIKTVQSAFNAIFKVKRWRSGFNDKPAVMRACQKGNPYAINIAKAMKWI